MWIKLDEEQKESINRVFNIMTAHYILSTHARVFKQKHVADAFCRNFRDEEE